MFGTIARAKVKPENRGALDELVRGQAYEDLGIDGFIASYTVWPEEQKDEVWLVAVFRDRASYRKNADSPEQDARYREFRALLESDPEWVDGEFVKS